MTERKGILRSVGAISLSTGLSRVLGFIRDLLIARLFGTTIQAQAFVVAFRLPNLFRDLVAEGAVTSAFVPVLSGFRARGEEAEFWKIGQALLNRLVVILLALAVVGVLFADPMVRVIAPGFVEDPQKFALTVLLTKLLFPFVVLVGLWAFFMAVLNSLKHFAAPALGPAILNLCMIIACIFFVPHTRPGILAVGVAVIIGGCIQVLVQVIKAVRMGFRWAWRWRHPGTSQVLKLMGPRILGSAAYQANILIHTALASLGSIVGAGAVAALYYANRLIGLPLALFGTATAQASLPTLSEHAAREDWEAFSKTLNSVIRGVLFLVIPSGVGLFCLSQPIVQVLFERGRFDAYSTAMTVYALRCYAIGIWAYAFGQLFTGAFYAMKDTWTPVRLSAETVVLNVILSLILMWPMRLGGLALAAAVSSMVNALRLLRAMDRRLGASLVAGMGGWLAKVLGASLIMGLACWRAADLFAAGALRPVVALALSIALGALLYGSLVAALRVDECHRFLRWVRGKNA